MIGSDGSVDHRDSQHVLLRAAVTVVVLLLVALVSGTLVGLALAEAMKWLVGLV
jgi:hypothetical protein